MSSIENLEQKIDLLTKQILLLASNVDRYSKAGKNLSQHFGLPHASTADKYDVYRVTPKAPTEVFVNAVA